MAYILLAVIAGAVLLAPIYICKWIHLAAFKSDVPADLRVMAWMKVAASVLGLLVLPGLLIPAILKIRESALRAQTNNNLKAIALAVHGFHDEFRRLPDAYAPAQQGGKNESLWFRLLPYVENEDAYRNGEWNLVVPEFVAPSDPSPGERAGLVSFAGNIRLFAAASLKPEAATATGKAVEVPAGTLCSKMNFGRFLDGTSNTLMMTTRYASCKDVKTWYAAGVFGECELHQFPSPGVGGFMGAGSHSTQATANAEPVTAMFQLYPDQQYCNPTAAIFGHSFGRGGMSVAMADSSIRNVSPSVLPIQFGNAICPADNAPSEE